MRYKVPSPKEIRKNFQKSDNIISHHIHRRISAYLTWIILHITLWAEGIALLTPIIDLLAVYSIFTGHFIWAAILTQLHLVVDSSDGEIARFRKTIVKRTDKQDQFGGFMDSMAGLLVFPFIIFSIGFVLDSLFIGLIGMGVFYTNVISSSYVKVYFPKSDAGKNISSKLKYKNYKFGFNSVIQKSLITLAILFQSLIFIWLFIIGGICMVVLRLYLYGKE